MHFLFSLGAATGLFLLKSPTFSKHSKIPHSPFDITFTPDCEWLCIKNGQKFNKHDVISLAQSMEKLFDVASSKKDFTNINELTKSAIKLINRNKCDVDKLFLLRYPLTFRQFFAEMSLWSAFYLRQKGKMIDDDLNLWITFSFPQLLSDLGLLTIGNFAVESLIERFENLSTDSIGIVLSKLYITLPYLKFISPIIMAKLFLIIFSAEQEFQIKENCTKYIYSQYGDFSPLATGKMHPFYEQQFNKMLFVVSEVQRNFDLI